MILGALFRGYRAVLNMCGLSGVQCFTISRGYGQPPVEACTGRLLTLGWVEPLCIPPNHSLSSLPSGYLPAGLGDSAYFYIDAVFVLNGLLASVLFLLGAYLG